VDWIERFLGLSPDGGDGSTEAVFLLLIAAGILACIGTFVRRTRQR